MLFLMLCLRMISYGLRGDDPVDAEVTVEQRSRGVEVQITPCPAVRSTLARRSTF